MGLKRQTLWSMLPLLVVTVVNIVSVPLFYRYLGAEMYALWLYVLTFTGVFGFMDLGLGVAVGRYIGVALGKGDTEAVREYWSTGNLIAIPLLIAMALAFTAVGVWFGPRWFNVSAENVPLLRWAFVAGGLSLFLAYYGQFWLILSQAHLDFRFLGILRTAMSLLQVLPSIYLAWLTRNPFVLIAWAAGIAALQLLVFIWHARHSYRLGFDLRSFRSSRAREMGSYAGKTFAMLLVNSFLGSIDRLVLGKLGSPASFAHYAICSNVGSRIQGLGGAVMGPVFSNTNRSMGTKQQGSVAAVYDETFTFVFPWYLLIAIWGILWHPALLRVWLGADLGSAVGPLFVPLLAGYCLTALSGIASAQLSALDRIGTALAYSAGAGAALACAIFLGWQWNGAVGAAWGFLASRVVLVVQDIHLVRWVAAGGWLAGSTWKHVAMQVAVALAFRFAAHALPPALPVQVAVAVTHGLCISAWLLRFPLRPIQRPFHPARAPAAADFSSSPVSREKLPL